MKKLILLLFISSIESLSFSAYSQCNARVLPFTEDFSGNPFGTCTSTTGGWTSTSVSSGAGWWISSPPTNYAGGTAPEVEAYGNQANGGVSETIRLISPPISTTGASSLTLSFKHNLYLENSGTSGSNVITIGVEVSPDNSSWSSLYSKTYNATSSLTSVMNETRQLTISGLSSDSIFIRFNISGVMFKVYGWEIDDINVVAPASTSIKNTNKNKNIVLYPNPVKEQVNIELNSNLYSKVTIFDISGKEVFKKQFFENKLNINTHNLASGIYILYIQNEEGTFVKKFSKE